MHAATGTLPVSRRERKEQLTRRCGAGPCIIPRAVADRYDLDADRDAYPRLLSTCAMTAVRVALFTLLGSGLATAEVRSRRG